MAETSVSVFIVASFGDGEPTDNAARFHKVRKQRLDRSMASLLNIRLQ